MSAARLETSIMLGRNPQLEDAFKELLPLAIYWEIIGTRLRLPRYILDKIEADEDTIRGCLREMLSEWLKWESSPTWKALVDAVECIDKFKAEEIRRRHYDVEHIIL